MRSVLWPDRRAKPLFGAAEIDRSDPLSRRLVSCIPVTSWPPVDLCSAGLGVPIGAIPTIGRHGLAICPNGGTNKLTLPSLPIAGATGFSVFIRYLHSSSTTEWDTIVSQIAAFDGTSEGNVNGFYLRHNLGAGWLGFAVRAGDGFSEISANAGLAAGSWYDVVGVCNAGAGTLYVNGASVATGTLSASVGTCSRPLTFGRNWEDQVPAGSVAVCYVWARALELVEIARLSVDPYGFLRPLKRRSYGIAATGGTTYEVALTLAVGSALSPSALANFSASAGLAAGAALADATTGALQSALALAAASALLHDRSATYPALATFAASCGVAPAATLSSAQAVTLTAAAQLSPATVATMLGALPLTAGTALSPGGTLAALAAASLAGQAALVASLGTAYLDSVGLSATAALSPSAVASFVTALSLPGGTLCSPAAILAAQAAAALTGQAALATSLGALYTDTVALAGGAGLSADVLYHAMAGLPLPVAAALTPSVQAALAAQLALQIHGDIALATTQVAQALVSLGVGAQVAQTTTALLEAALALSVASILAQVAGLNLLDPALIRLVAVSLTSAALPGVALTTPVLTGISLTTPTLTGVTLESAS